MYVLGFLFCWFVSFYFSISWLDYDSFCIMFYYFLYTCAFCIWPYAHGSQGSCLFCVVILLPYSWDIGFLTKPGISLIMSKLQWSFCLHTGSWSRYGHGTFCHPSTENKFICWIDSITLYNDLLWCFLLLLMLPVLLSHSCFPLACGLHGVFPIFITFICSSIAFISLLLVIGHRRVWSVSVTWHRIVFLFSQFIFKAIRIGMVLLQLFCYFFSNSFFIVPIISFCSLMINI